MKVAAIIYLLSGVALLVTAVGTAFVGGVRPGTFVLVIFAVALLVIARSLFLRRATARRRAMFLSAIVALAFGVIDTWFVIEQFPALRKFGVPAGFWSLVGVNAGISLAYGLALVMLLRSSDVVRPYDCP